ncbi:MAG TPA: acyltransferase [Fimbriimonas sp.]|nr:acyltransferase [Fimbriimonas sp.]
MSPPTRWQFLDAIRGIAALAVVIQHVFWFVDPSFEEFFSTVFSPGRFGVVAFFIVSGFIVPHSLEAKGDVKAFWKSRFFRLFPAYWASLLLIALVLVALQRQLPPPSVWAFNLTMMQGFFKRPDINPVAWTLGIEMLLYAGITAAFVVGVIKRTWVVSVVLLGLIGVASVVMPLVFHMRFPAGAAAVGGSIVLGLVLYRWFTGNLAKVEAAILGASCLAVTVLSSIVNYTPQRLASAPLQPTQLCAILSVVAGYAFFLGFLALKDKTFPGWILWLGRVSYSLYLFHPVAGMVVPDSIPHWPKAGIEIALSIVMAWAGYTFIEKPFLGLSKKRQPVTN